MLRYLTSGESHGKSLISILDGIPANIELNIDEINYELEKRQGGYGRGGRMKIEKDKINILGGVRGKITLGGPISIEIKNKDYENWIQYMNPMDNIDFETKKVEKVRQFRLSSKAKTTNGYAKVPQLFAQITQPDDVDFLIIPSVSSERRRYVPIGFATQDIISSNAVQIVPNATLYHFGVLTSNVHMAWMRAVCGRLKSDYRYSKEIVYNTFPWPKPTEEQRIKIEQTAQVILNAREQYSDCSLADMYGEKMYLFPELVKAHQDNDRAVMQAYGFTKGSEAYKSEAACVAELMKLYQKKVEELEKR